MSERGNQIAIRSLLCAAIRLSAFVLLLAPGTGLRAQPEDPGDFRIVTASHELIDGVYHVDARIYLRLSTEAQRALRFVPLTIRIEIEFLNRLRFWIDNTEVRHVQEYQLEYLSVSDRYVVRDMQVVNKETSYPRLADALEVVGKVDSLPIVDAVVLDRDLRYEVRIRAVLDKNDLPGPLSWFNFFRKDFSINSGWFVWRLDDE